MSDRDRDWTGYIRSLSLNGISASSTPQELQRSGGTDTELGWTEEQGGLSRDLLEEFIILLDSGLLNESGAPESWDEDKEENFKAEINSLYEDWEKDRQEIEDNKRDTEE